MYSHRISYVITAWAATAAFSQSACIPSFRDDQSLIDEVRVLAVRSEPAEPSPGATVKLTALATGPQGEVLDPASVRWSVCKARKPLTELGSVAPECLAGESGAVQSAGEGFEIETQIASDVCRVYGPLAPAAQAGSTVTGRPVDPDASGGFYQPIVLSVAGQPTIAGVRVACGVTDLPQTESITFNQGYRPNENPVIERVDAVSGGVSSELSADGATTLTVAPGARIEFSASWAACPTEPVCGDGLCTAGENPTTCAQDCQTEPHGCTGAETYLLADLETREVVRKQEELRAAWYATAGTFEEAQTAADESGVAARNRWTAPATAQAVTLWIVVRDDRGGADWREIQVQVE